MTRASFFAALAAPFLLPFRAAPPKRPGTLKCLLKYGDGDIDGFEEARRRFMEADTAHEQMRQEMLKDLSILDERSIAAQGEEVEVLSSWIDPNSGDVIALVVMKKSAPKPNPSLYS